jgi:hypothetical protein
VFVRATGYAHVAAVIEAARLHSVSHCFDQQPQGPHMLVFNAAHGLRSPTEEAYPCFLLYSATERECPCEMKSVWVGSILPLLRASLGHKYKEVSLCRAAVTKDPASPVLPDAQGHLSASLSALLVGEKH